jgi:4-amino-4-deoxy-L-arabinose transferase-like glycosyltransferase
VLGGDRLADGMQEISGIRRRSIVALALLAVGLGLYFRWELFYLNYGQVFVPRPDSLEYAAGAEAIADHGRYFLQVGRFEVRSRYPPGFSMALALPLALGVDGEDVWRVKSAAGTAIAFLLAWWVASALRRRGIGEAAAVAAGALAAAHWLLLPLNLAQGNMLMSDEPVALLAVVAVALLARAWREGAPGVERPERQWRWLLAAGFVLGAIAITRSIAAALIVPAVLPFAWLLWRRAGWLAVVRVAGWLAAGGCLPILACIWLLHRSGFPPLAWTAYAFWVPEFFGPGTHPLHWQWAIAGNPHAPLPGGAVAPHLVVGARILGGVPGPLLVWETYGRLWPLVGWTTGLLLAWRAWREGSGVPRATVVGAGLAVAATWLFFACYGFPGGRFYLAAMVLCALLFWVGIGSLLRYGLPARLAALALAGLAFWGALHPVLSGKASFNDRTNFNWHTREMIEDWLKLGDEGRAASRLPVDPILAQALGLMKAETLRPIHGWGGLPETEHIWRLVVNGHLTPGGTDLGPNADRRFIHLSPVAGTDPPRKPIRRFNPAFRTLFDDGFESGDTRYWSQRVDKDQPPGSW